MSKVGTIVRRPRALPGVCWAVMTVIRGMMVIVLGATVIGFAVASTVLVITGDVLESSQERVLVTLPSQPLKEFRSAGNPEASSEKTVESWVHSGPVSFQLWSWPDLFRSWLFRLIVAGVFLSLGMWVWGMIDQRKPGRRPQAPRSRRPGEPTDHIRVRSPLHR